MKDKGKSSKKSGSSSRGTRRTSLTGSGSGRARSAAGRAPKRAAPAQIEACFQAVFEGSRDAIGVSKAGVHVLVNPAYRAMFGFPPDADLAGMPILDLIAPERRDQVKEYVARRARGESVPAIYETRGLRADGSPFDMEVNVSRYHESGEELALVILRNITERRMAEQEIAERGAMLQQIMDTASVAIFLVNKSGRITHANHRMAEMFGREMQDLIGSEYVSLVHPSERETGRGKMLALLASEIPSVDLERRYWRKDGTEFWGHLAGRRFHDARGNEIGLIGVITDIDKRKRAEEALRASESRTRSIIESIPVGMHLYRLEPDGRLIFAGANPAADTILGVDNSIFIGKTIEDAFPPLKETEVPQRYRDVARSGRAWQTESIVYEDNAVKGVFEVHAFQTAPDTMVAAFADVTARKRSEFALKQSEAKYRRLYNETPVLLHSIDRNGILVEVNDYWLQTLGYERNEVIGRKVTDFYTDASRKYAQEVIQPAFFRDGAVKDIPYQFIRKNGDVVEVLLSATSERDAAGNVVRSQAVITDITERKRAEDLLRQSEARYRMLYEGTPVMMHSIDAEGRLVSVSGQWLKTLGYTKDEVLGRRSTEFLDEQSGNFARTVVLPAFLQTGICTDVPYTFVKKNGERISTLLSAIAERDGTGKVVRSLAVILDITEKERSEQALRESEERYRQLFDAESDAVLLIDNATGRILMANSAASVLYGYRVEELLEKKNTDLSVEPSETRRVTEETPVMKDNAVIIPLRYHCKKDGTVFPVEITGRFFTYKDRPVHIAAIRDITERKKAEEALRESEERFRAITMTASDAILLMDDKGTIVYWNPAAERIFGYSADEAVGRALHGFLAPRRLHAEYHKGFARFVKTGQGPVINRSVEMVALKKDGTEFPMEVSTSAMNIGGTWHALGIVRDITERKQLEQERLKAQKLESIGTLAGGIAHDFNNLLQGIFGYISMAKLTIDQREKSLAMLEQAEKALHQSVNLTSQLLTFSKGGKPVKKAVDLRPVIENAVKFALSGSRLEYGLLFDAELSTVEADEGQIGQVVQNLVLNAEQAMPLGGRIEIAARNVPPTQAAGLPLSAPEGIVEIVISDQGTGILPGHLPRIFDPYFTTKERGSGLGLATSYSIVKNHEGMISVTSEPGKGSTFTVYLPATRAAPEHAASLSAGRTEGRKGKVLVMDDEAIVRVVAGELLRELGHEAEFAEHGDSAIEKYKKARAEGRPFDAVILDLTIRGGKGGAETLRELLEIDPGVKAVVSSGYSDDEVIATFRQQGFHAFLKKPYSIGELRVVLDAVLA